MNSKTNKTVRIGLRFNHPNNKIGIGVILQSYLYLPPIKEDRRKGPWFGVHYDTSKYQWYHIDDITKLLVDCRIE
jgi:hypothetical protein